MLAYIARHVSNIAGAAQMGKSKQALSIDYDKND